MSKKPSAFEQERTPIFFNFRKRNKKGKIVLWDEITCIFAHEFEKSGSRRSSGGIGRHAGLKIQWTVRSVWVQVPS